jgi:hypothetical protein
MPAEGLISPLRALVRRRCERIAIAALAGTHEGDHPVPRIAAATPWRRLSAPDGSEIQG